MRDIGERLGLSVATVSRGLRGDPSVRAETRGKILAVAQELGYCLNPRVGELMSSIRRGDPGGLRGLIALVWVSGSRAAQNDRRFAEIRNGVVLGASEHGLNVDQFWMEEHRPRALARILFHRGIDGVLLCAPASRPGCKLVDFPLADFAVVCLGWGLSELQAPSARFDYFHGMRSALAEAGTVFGSRIAAVWSGATDLRAHGAARAGFLVHHPGGAALAAELFFDGEKLCRTETLKRLRQHQVQGLVVGAGLELPIWLARATALGHRVEFMPPGNRKIFGWIDTQNSLMGRWGAEMLAARMLGCRTGLRQYEPVTLVPPVWRGLESASG
jgi:hypothetical protein